MFGNFDFFVTYGNIEIKEDFKTAGLKKTGLEEVYHQRFTELLEVFLWEMIKSSDNHLPW